MGRLGQPRIQLPVKRIILMWSRFLILASVLCRPAKRSHQDVVPARSPGQADDLLNSDRVMGSDGTQAFEAMVAAVKGADERVKGFEGELTKVLEKAESSRMSSNYRK